MAARLDEKAKARECVSEQRSLLPEGFALNWIRSFEGGERGKASWAGKKMVVRIAEC